MKKLLSEKALNIIKKMQQKMYSPLVWNVRWPFIPGQEVSAAIS